MGSKYYKDSNDYDDVREKEPYEMSAREYQEYLWDCIEKRRERNSQPRIKRITRIVEITEFDD